MLAAQPFAGGSGTPADPYQICTSAQLVNIDTALDKSFVLLTDLDFSTDPISPLLEIANPEIKPGGFTGQLDGKGHVIAKLVANHPLFGLIAKAGSLHDLKMTDAVVTGLPGATSQRFAPLAERNEGTIADCTISGTVTGARTLAMVVAENAGTISNCQASGTITASSTLSGGGITGSLESTGTVDHCTSDVSITGSGAVGGIAGSMGGTATLKRSSSSGTLKGTGTVSQPNDPGIGGLVGYLGGGTVQTSYSTAHISGPGIVGGLVGSIYANLATAAISQTYFAGTANLEDAQPEPPLAAVGGLIGSQAYGGTITQSFAAGAVTASGPRAPAGVANGDSGFTAVYWDVTRTGVATAGAGGAVAGCTAVNAANATPNYWFQATSAPLSSWSFTPGTGDWTMPSGDFPKLQ
jgi:hypothetical protein